MMNKIEELAKRIDKSNNIVFFGGAGVSTESGIPDFRGASGVYNEKLNTNISPEEIVSSDYFYQFPEEFFSFYREKLLYPQAKPNSCHKALARLEEMGKLKAIITQNIDDLHQQAGSKVVYQLHGTVMKNHCLKCNKFYKLEDILNMDNVPTCSCGGIIKPDVVLYGESLDEDTMVKSIEAIAHADLLIVGGTSLVVYPAASFINYFRGSTMALINLTKTNYDSNADIVINDKIGKVFNEIMKYLEQ
ncbi:MAG: NAD-dependent protein deacylase [Ezakiella sp.]|nr:NAD-dependent protein deacylase [Ezakiella sp.]